MKLCQHNFISSYCKECIKYHKEIKKIKDRVRNIAMQARRNGILIKQNCQFCGDRYTEMHHQDYTKPLEVTWLCHKCHMRFHRDCRK